MNLRQVLLGILVIGACGRANAQFVYSTSFEEAQGFVAGQTLDLQGLDSLGVWHANPPERVFVVNDQARTGVQSVRMTPSSDVGGSNAAKIVSIRNLTQPVVNGQVSMMIQPSWFPGASDSAQAFTQFDFVKGSHAVKIGLGFQQMGTGPAQILMKYSTSEPFAAAVVAPISPNANQWYDLRFAWNVGAANVAFYLNNQLIGSVDNFICNCPLRSDQISFINQRSTGEGEHPAYFDDLGLAAAVPEPSTYLAMGIGFALVVRKRRKK